MEIKQTDLRAKAIKFEVQDGNKIAGRAYLYLIYNDLGEGHYGLLEDVFVEEKYRGQGVGNQLLTTVIATAKKLDCYKLIGTSRYSRPQVHAWYERLGFRDYGKEFRMDF